MITYFFADGTRSQVTGVDTSLEELVRDMTRLEENLERKERYHTVSLDNMVYEGLDFASREPNAEEKLVAQEEEKEKKAMVETALSVLNEKQRRRIEMRFFQGLKFEEIAEREGVSLSSLHESITGALKKMRKLF